MTACRLQRVDWRTSWSGGTCDLSPDPASVCLLHHSNHFSPVLCPIVRFRASRRAGLTVRRGHLSPQEGTYLWVPDARPILRSAKASAVSSVSFVPTFSFSNVRMLNLTISTSVGDSIIMDRIDANSKLLLDYLSSWIVLILSLSRIDL